MDLAYELHDLVRTLDRWAEQILRPEGLSYNQYVALVILHEHPGLTGRTLARALGVTEAAASGVVKALLAAGLVTDHSPSGAGNRRELHLTPSGSEKMTHCSALLGHSVDDNARAVGIDPQALATTIRALHDEVRTIRTPTESEPS
ncbi:MarR family transcriptional regulator [Microbacterium sp. ARD32]|uniref:MarR family winged helix-turn-helix transcriptional regulator n=1 Tax=Microbacterium sp. ARD32 TaxID=2962577 RepID=UPI002882A241|nr:MarR family transcriptional regulator [Microbacterium sp. ARD32]MDT0156031.1 MarR family transcriptional regulator [Microbacterium sp. ARD32]